jgi:hypothetical protein
MKATILAIILLIMFCCYCRPLHTGEIRQIITQSIAVDLTYSDRFPVVMKTRNMQLKRKSK